MHLSRFSSIIPCIILINNFLFVQSDDFPSTKLTFPSLWTIIGKESSYHIVYQLEIDRLTEVLRIEEWASFEDQMFRIDLITGTSRKSYMTNGKTGEIFLYKPFICELIDKKSKDFEIFTGLFIGYPLIKPNEVESTESKDKLAYGIGPLWLRAQTKAKISAAPPYKFDKREGLLFEESFDRYQVSFDDREPFKLMKTIEFLFPADSSAFVDSIVWVSKKGDGSSYSAAIAKIVQVDLGPISASIFKLPVGYGCRRDDKLDQELNIDVGQVLLHQGYPNQVIFEVKTSTPTNNNLESWYHRDYSISMSRHPIKREVDIADTENYYITISQERDLNTGQLKRIKRIWWSPTSKRAHDIENNNDTNPSDQNIALVYEIDLSSSKCEVAYKNVNDQIILEFPNNESVMLSIDQISFLFGDNSDYHLIDEGEQFGDGKVRGVVYEKRVKHFKLKSGGQVKWNGSVSLIKRISSYSRYLDQRIRQKFSSLDKPKSITGEESTLYQSSDYSVILTILFYTENFNQLLHKAVIELMDNHMIDYDYVHKQLDVSSCFKPEQQHDIVLRYPVQDTKYITNFDSKRKQLELILYVNLFEQTSISPLQISSIEISFDYFYMHLKLKLLDLPLNHMFAIDRGYKLQVNAANRKALVGMTASTLDKCADHCEHYNCFRFTYDYTNRDCYVELSKDKVEIVSDELYDLFTFVARPKQDKLTIDWQLKSCTPDGNSNPDQDLLRPHLNVRSIIEMFQEMTEDKVGLENNEMYGENPLNLRVALSGQEEDVVLLKPTVLDNDLESMNEFVKELEAQAGSNGDETQLNEDDLTKFANQMSLEYQLILENRAFEVTDKNAIRMGLTYEECATYCENTDCRSFSYCQGDSGECKVTNFHQDKIILKHSKIRAYTARNFGCNIYTLDYLSKFEPLGKAKLGAVLRTSVDAKSPRDCANLCIESQNFDCQGFYFCKIKAEYISASSDIYRCHSVDTHVNTLMGYQRKHIIQLEDPNLTSPSDDTEKDLSAGRSCWYYSRSYLAQFDKFYGRKLELIKSTSIGDNLSIIGMNSEQCARRCIQINCLAFDVCPMKNNRYSSQTCQLTIKQFGQKQLKADKQCTTFVLSDKSQFNNWKAVILRDKGDKPIIPDKEATVDRLPPTEQGIEKLEDGSTTSNSVVENTNPISNDLSKPALELIQGLETSHIREPISNNGPGFWAKIGSFLLGTGAGSSLIAIYNEAYARGWLNQAQIGIARLLGA